MSVIVAKNQKGHSRTFTQIQWNLLGRDKNGWVQTEAQIIESTLVTGEKQKNAMNPIAEQIEEAGEVHPQVIKVLAFERASVGISKTDLQSYLRKNNIEFEASLKSKELVGLIGIHCEWNAEIFKTAF